MRREHLQTKEVYKNAGEVIFCHTEQYIDDAKDILSNTQNSKVRKRVTMKDIAEDYLKIKITFEKKLPTQDKV